MFQFFQNKKWQIILSIQKKKNEVIFKRVEVNSDTI